ncbi:hypothetical protein ACL1E1_13415, partial [Corynebacterium striatum]
MFHTIFQQPDAEAVWTQAREVVEFCQAKFPHVADYLEEHLDEVPRVLFLGLCLVFHYFSTGVVFPKIGFYFSRRAVAQALVEP